MTGAVEAASSLEKTMRNVVILAIGVISLAGCTTANTIRGSSGEQLVMVECGAATSFSLCYDRAAKECPNGYRTVSEDTGFNRKTLKVECSR